MKKVTTYHEFHDRRRKAKKHCALIKREWISSEDTLSLSFELSKLYVDDKKEYFCHIESFHYSSVKKS